MSDDYLTDAEQRAVDRVEKAIKALPKSVCLYFHGGHASVMRTGSDGHAKTEEFGVGLSPDDCVGTLQTPRCQAGDF